MFMKGDSLLIEIPESNAKTGGINPCAVILSLSLPPTRRGAVCEYPDSGKVNILPYQEIYKTRTRVDYYGGERGAREKWPADIGHCWKRRMT
jgi:hypothetical protein